MVDEVIPEGGDPLLDFMNSRGLGPGRDIATPGVGKESNDFGTFIAEAKSRRAAPPPVGSKADLLGTASLLKKEYLEAKREQISLDRFIDGDSIRSASDSVTGERGTSMRLGYDETAERYVDSPEMWHGEEFNKKRLDTYSGRKADIRQRMHLADQLGIDVDDLTNEQRQKAGEDALTALRAAAMEGQEDQSADPYLTVGISGVGAHGRDIRIVTNPFTGKNILDSQNTPELNTDYDSKYNVGIRREIIERQIVADDLAAEKRAKTAIVSDEMMENPIGQTINMVASLVSGGITTAAWMTNAAPETLAFAARSQVSNPNKALYKSRRVKEEERIKAQNVLNNKEAPSFVKAWARQALKNGNFVLTPEEKGLDKSSDAISPYQIMKGVEILESEVTGRVNKAKKWFNSLPNKRSADEANARNAKVWKGAAKDWNNATRAFSEGRTGDAISNVASSVGGWMSGFADTATNNPGAVANTFVESYPQMMAMMGKGAVMAAASMGMITDIASKGRQDFIKEHGREPNTKELAVIWGIGVLSTGAEKVGAHGIFDKFKSKAVTEVGKKAAESIIKSALNEAVKRGVVVKTLNVARKAAVGTVVGAAKTVKFVGGSNLVKRPLKGGVTETATEFGQGVGEEYAGKQDLDKVEYEKAYGGSVLGGLSGAGASAALGTGETLAAGEKGVAKVASKVSDIAASAKEKVDKVKSSPEANVARATDKTAKDYSPVKAVNALAQSYKNIPVEDKKAREDLITKMTDHRGELGKKLAEVSADDVLSSEQKLAAVQGLRSDIRTVTDTIEAIDKAEDKKAAPEVEQAVSDLSDTDVTKHTPEAKASVNTALTKMVTTFGNEDFSQFDDIKDPDIKEAVSLAQKAVKTRLALVAALKKKGRHKKQVHEEAMRDDYSRWGKKGLAMHVNTINAALDAGDQKGARDAIKSLMDFKKIQQEKYEAFKNADSVLEASGLEEVPVLWGTEANRKDPFMLTTKSPGAGVNIAKFEVLPEITAIEAQIAFANKLGIMKFGDKNKVSKPASQAAPVAPPEQVPDRGATAQKAPEAPTPAQATSPQQEAQKPPVPAAPAAPVVESPAPLPPAPPKAVGPQHVVPFDKEGLGKGVLKKLQDKLATRSKKKQTAAVQKRDAAILKNTKENLSKMGVGSHVYTLPSKTETGRVKYVIQKMGNTGKVSIKESGVADAKTIIRDISNLRSEPVPVNQETKPKIEEQEKPASPQPEAQPTAQEKKEALTAPVITGTTIVEEEKEEGENKEAKDVPEDLGFAFGEAVSMEEANSIPMNLGDYADAMTLQEQAEEQRQDTNPLDDDTVNQLKGGSNVLMGDLRSQTPEEIGLGQDEDGVPAVPKEPRKTMEDTANAYIDELNYVKDTVPTEEKHAFRRLAEDFKRFINRFVKKLDPQQKLRKILDGYIDKASGILDPYRKMVDFAERFSAVPEEQHSQPFYKRMKELADTSYRAPDARNIRDNLAESILDVYNKPGVNLEALNSQVEQVAYQFQLDYGFPSASENILHNGHKQLDELFTENKDNPNSILGVMPDFFSRLKTPEVGRAFIKERDLNEQDTKNTKVFMDFRNEFEKALNNIQEYYYDGQEQNDYTHLFRSGFIEGNGSVKEGTNNLPENVISALAMNSINWVGTQARDTLNKPDAAINTLLGRDSKQDIESAAYDMLQDIGMLNKTIIRDLGRPATQQLNMKARDDADGRSEAKMEKALGLLALRTLEEMGYIEISKIEMSEIKKLRTSAENAQIQDEESKLFFSRVKSVDNPLTGGQIMDPKSDGGKMLSSFVEDNYAETMEKLFDLKPYKVFPNDKPGTKEVDKIQGSIQTPSADHKKGLLFASQVAHVGKVNSIKLMDGLTENDLYEIAGVETDISNVHITEEKSTVAKNEHIVRNFEHIRTFLDGREVDKPFYFDYKMIMNLRAYDTSNTVTLQNSKIDRFLFGQQSWKVDVDLTDAVQKMDLEVGIAGAFKIGADKLHYDMVVKELHESVVNAKGEVNEKYSAGVEAIKKRLFSETPLEASERRAIVDAIKTGKDKFHTYDGLVALAQYSHTLDQGLTVVKDIELAREIDGTTNGPISAAIQMGLDYDDAVRILKAGGVHFKGDPDEHLEYGEYISQPGKYDNYQALAIVIDGILKKNAEAAAATGDTIALSESSALKEVMGNLLRDQSSALAGDLAQMSEHPDVESRGRDLNKGAVMTSAYGAGMLRIAQNLKDLVVKNFYADLMKVKDDVDGVTRLFTALAQMGIIPSMSQEAINDMVAKKEVKNFKLNIHQTAALENMVEKHYVAPMKEALKQQLGSFFEHRDTINDGLRIMNEIFAKVIGKEIAKFKAENNERYPSRAEQREIVLKLRDAGMFPMVMHPTSDPNDYSTFLEISVKEEVTVEEGGDITSYVKGRAKKDKAKNPLEVNDYTFVEKNGELVVQHAFSDQHSLGAKVTMAQYLGDIGISGFPPLNQSMDASVQAIAMQIKHMVNVFDAQLGGIANSAGNALLMNKTYLRLHSEWSMAEAVQEAVTRMGDLAAGRGDIKDYKLDSDDVAAITTNMKKTLTTYVGKEEVVSTMSDFVKKTKLSLTYMAENKDVVMSNVTAIDQYPNTGSIFRLKENLQGPPTEAEVDARIQEWLMPATDTKAKGSQAGGYADVTADYDKLLEADKTQQIFDDLENVGNVRETTQHAAYLKDYMRNVINPAMRKLDDFRLFVGDSASNSKGQMKVSTGDVVGIHIAGGSGAVLAGTEMSVQEVFAHELTHGVWHKGINEIPKVRNEVTRLYDLAKENIKPEDFLRRDASGNVKVAVSMQEELAAAQKRYDYVFDTESGYLHEFATLGTTNEAFMAALNKLKNTKAKVLNGTFVDQLVQLFLNIVDWIGQNTYNRSKSTVGEALQMMALDIQNINDKNINKIDQAIENNLSAANYFGRTQIVDKAHEKLKKHIAKRRLVNDKSPIVRAADVTVALGEYVAKTEFREKANDLAYDLGLNKDNPVYKLISEVAGADAITQPFHKLLRYSKKYREQEKQNEETQVTKQVRDMFEDGKQITDEDWTAINDGGLKTDLTVTMKKHAHKKTAEFLRDGGVRGKEISRLKQEIKDNFKTNHKFYTKQSENLGSIMARGFAGLNNSLLNAHSIANLHGTQGKIGHPEGDIGLAKELVDQLAGLYAIQYTEQGKREIVANYIDSEYARDPKSNGMQFLLKQHELFKKESLKDLFDSNETLMLKGWTSENYNEYKSMRVGTADQAADFANDGAYVEHSDIQRDSLATMNTPLKLYVSNQGLMNRTVTGIVSRTGKNSKGAKLDQQYRDAGFEDGAYIEASAEFMRHRDKALRSMKKQFTEDIPLDFSKNYMLPVMGPKGDIVNYRYTMNESTKVNAMDKNDLAHETMGRMSASLIDKVQTDKFNTALLAELKRDHKVGYAENPRDFIKIGPDVANEKHREIYRLLPSDTIQALEDIWGKKEFYVREGLLDLAFGFRKASLTEWLDNKLRFEDGTGGLPTFIKNGMRIAGLLWMAVIGKAKKNIVMFTPAILIANVGSNLLLSILNGVPPIQMFKDQIRAIKYLNKYQRDNKRIDELKRLIKSAPRHSTVAGNKAELKKLQHDIAINPVKPLVDEGLFQTLVEDIELETDQLNGALLNALPDVVGTTLKKTEGLIPDVVKKTYHHLTLGPDSEIAQVLTQATQYSDFVARFALYENHKRKGMGHAEAIQDVIDVFINYDVPTSPEMQWMNDMGLLMYTKFLFRIQRVIAKSFVHAPVTAAMIEATQQMVGDTPDVFDSNMISNSFLTGPNVGYKNIMAGPFGEGHLDDAYSWNLLNYMWPLAD